SYNVCFKKKTKNRALGFFVYLRGKYFE
ncbi:permease of the major facilitator superfamily domain protein, partial [Vibrio parahaemolyticus V-223/04]